MGSIPPLPCTSGKSVMNGKGYQFMSLQNQRSQMKKQTIIRISITFFLSITVVFVLYVNAEKYLNYHFNSFDRTFIHDPYTGMQTLSLGYNSYYYAGNTSHHIYLGNSTAPTHILQSNLTLADTTHLHIDIHNPQEYKVVKVQVDSPYVYLFDGTIPFIYKGTLHSKTITPCVSNVYFTEALSISNNSFALNAVYNLENTLEKKTIGVTPPEIYSNLLEAQGEGLFSTDGLLRYDKQRARLTYVYFYRNEFINIDTNFNLLSRGHTIDTISHVKINVSEISSQSYTMSKPPLAVNNDAALSGKYLFINSNLLSRNEILEEFRQQSVIDVYDLTNNAYQFSFYIPFYDQKKMNGFRVIDQKKLVIIYPFHMVTFDLDPAIFLSDEGSTALSPQPSLHP